uniref:CSON001167 protein n=1 Tax=Culicoides sonorensis TaxID=179676 RepID=A0A336K4S8_CULSO
MNFIKICFGLLLVVLALMSTVTSKPCGCGGVKSIETNIADPSPCGCGGKHIVKRDSENYENENIENFLIVKEKLKVQK